MAEIKEVQFTIPVSGLQYTDVRPVITGEDWDGIKAEAQKIAESVGNEKLAERLGGQTGLTSGITSSGEVLGDGVIFNKEDHTYAKNGLPYLSGSTFAHMFEQEFPRETVASKVAARDDKDIEDVLEGWDSKGQISLDYGTLIHKCIETYLKFGELPSNAYLADIVKDWHEVFGHDLIESSELFIQDDEHQMCGVVDAFGEYTVYDWKTNVDLGKKVKFKTEYDMGALPKDTLGLYTLQLNFYRYILEQNGKKVNKMIIGWLSGDHWEKVPVPIIDIKPYLEQVWKPKKLSSN